MNIAIIGAGMAGLAAGTGLVGHGHTVTMYDKGRGPGGRMSTRRIATRSGEAQFDHGAQYFTVRDREFADQVARWADAGDVARWPAAGPDAWVGTPAMNAPVKAMAQGLDVTWGSRIDTIARLAEGWSVAGEQLRATVFDALVLAVPAEQAAELLKCVEPALAELARTTVSTPCWTVMAAFATALPGDADVLRGDGGPIGWAARNSAKPRRSGPEAWIIQGSPGWSAEHLEDDPGVVIDRLIRALSARLGAMPEPLSVTAHRWRYARSGRAGGQFRWNAERGLGLCGDWLIEPRVEAAWSSGHCLARAIAA